MDKFTRSNAKSLGIDINKMTMQQAGILASAHYGGVGGAKRIIKGDRGYLHKNFYGKSQYGYMTDIYRRMAGTFK